MRLVVRPIEEGSRDGRDVTVELLNASDRAVTLRADWPYEEEQGELTAYVEAAVSIEAYPPIAPWIGGVMAPHRKSPQPEHVLPPGETLSVTWTATGRRLKDRVTNPNEVQNPEFVTPGLYSVHATLVLKTDTGPVLLRSNEQLVSFGGSRELPKHSYGTLLSVDAESKTATFSLGSLQRIEPGDEFLFASKRGAWRLTIARAEPNWSHGTLEPVSHIGPNPAPPDPPLPEPGAGATLIVSE